MNTSKAEFKKRLNICESCPEYRPLTKQCKKCNCFLILKAFLKTSKCPLGKWRETKNDNSQD